MTMSNLLKNPLTAAWIIFVGAVLADCAWLAASSNQPSSSPRGAVEAFVHRLEQKGIHLHAVAAAASGDIRQGVYLCVKPRPRNELHMMRIPEAIERWKGIVFVERCPRSENVALLGGEDCVAVIDSCVVFGDPDLVQRIGDVMGDG
jgi:hypothetical protein